MDQKLVDDLDATTSASQKEEVPNVDASMSASVKQ